MSGSSAAFAAVTSSVGPAGARALREVRDLASEAPAGRLFASIATLVDSLQPVSAGLLAGDIPRVAHAVAALDLACDPVNAEMGFLRKAG